MKYLQCYIISIFVMMSTVLLQSSLPISNDAHKHAMYWAKNSESEVKYSQLALSLIPCPPPFPVNEKSNKAKANPVEHSKALKRPLEYPLTREASVVVVESDRGVRLRRPVGANK